VTLFTYCDIFILPPVFRGTVRSCYNNTGISLRRLTGVFKKIFRNLYNECWICPRNLGV